MFTKLTNMIGKIMFFAYPKWRQPIRTGPRGTVGNFTTTPTASFNLQQGSPRYGFCIQISFATVLSKCARVTVKTHIWTTRDFSADPWITCSIRSASCCLVFRTNSVYIGQFVKTPTSKIGQNYCEMPHFCGSQCTKPLLFNAVGQTSNWRMYWRISVCH